MGIAVVILALFLFFSKLTIILVLMAASILMSLFVGATNIKIIGLELVSFVSIITGVIAGPIVGMVVALILIVFHMFMTRSMGLYLLWVIPAYPFVALLASIFSHTSITPLGIALTFILHGIFILFTLILYPNNLVKHLPWSITGILLNVFYFRYFAPLIIHLVV